MGQRDLVPNTQCILHEDTLMYCIQDIQSKILKAESFQGMGVREGVYFCGVMIVLHVQRSHPLDSFCECLVTDHSVSPVASHMPVVPNHACYLASGYFCTCVWVPKQTVDKHNNNATS